MVATGFPVPLVCPECGEAVEITAKVWLMFTEDGVIIPGFDQDFVSEESQMYCTNDHNLDEWASLHGLFDMLNEWLEQRLAVTPPV